MPEEYNNGVPDRLRQVATGTMSPYDGARKTSKARCA